MSSKYVPVTDPELAVQYYEAGLLYRRVLTCKDAVATYEFLPFFIVNWRRLNGKPQPSREEHIAAAVNARHTYILIED